MQKAREGEGRFLEINGSNRSILWKTMTTEQASSRQRTVLEASKNCLKRGRQLKIRRGSD